MWLRNPRYPIMHPSMQADNRKSSAEIAERQAAGWVPVEPLLIKHYETGVVHFVDHPAHQQRLLQEGGKIMQKQEKQEPADVDHLADQARKAAKEIKR